VLSEQTSDLAIYVKDLEVFEIFEEHNSLSIHVKSLSELWWFR